MEDGSESMFHTHLEPAALSYCLSSFVNQKMRFCKSSLVPLPIRLVIQRRLVSAKLEDHATRLSVK